MVFGRHRAVEGNTALRAQQTPFVVNIAQPEDVLEEFSHRSWHTNVRCEWDGASLLVDGMYEFVRGHHGLEAQPAAVGAAAPRG